MLIRKVALACTVAALVALIVAPSASASFPGHNGRIAYTTNKQQIALVRSDGTYKTTVTHFSSPGFMEAPMFSADGHWIVFDGDNGGGNTDLFVMKADSSHLRRITHDATYEWSPSWSPSGKWIVFANDGGNSPIMVIHPDGTHQHRIGTGIGEYPRFSPDGSKIVYGSGVDGQIHVMRANGSHDHALTSAGGDYPDWSPSGRLIGFSSGSSGTSEVWIMRADGSHKHRVTTTGASYSPVFSPDGVWITFSLGSAGSAVWVSKIDGSHQHQIVGSEGGCCLGWQPLS